MTYKMVADIERGVLKAFNTEINISCIVRNEVNGWRKKDQVVYSIPDGKPIQPRQFPKGTWAVGKPDPREGAYLAPYFIPTDAWQYLPIWTLDSKKCYLKESLHKTKDKGYGLHYSESTSTQGCIKVNKLTDLLWLVNMIRNHQATGDVVILEVV